MYTQMAGPYGTELLGPYGTQLVGPYGTELANGVGKTYAGLQSWQWMFVAGAALLTGTGALVAHYKAKPKGRAMRAAGIGALGGAVAGGLFAYALGKA